VAGPSSIHQPAHVGPDDCLVLERRCAAFVQTSKTESLVAIKKSEHVPFGYRTGIIP
jgi:hypothetical protein